MNAPTSPSRYVGQAIDRFEDDRLIRGLGHFIGDTVYPDMAHGVVLRSSWPHARILSIDISAALDVPGVLGCYTAKDLAADGIGGIPWEVCPPAFQDRARFRGDPEIAPPQPLLAEDRVRYVGEPIAFVLATSRHAASAGAEAIIVETEDLPSVIDAAAALAEGAPELHDNAPGNLLFSHEVGDAEAVARLFDEAAEIVTLSSHSPRLSPAPIETRGYVGHFDAQSGRYTLHAAAGKPHPVRNTLAEAVLKVDPKTIHVLARDIGGGFGGKNVVHAEQGLVLWASRKTGRPVKWIADRTEGFLSDMQGRDHRVEASMALDSEARILAVRYRSVIALGAWLAPRAVIPCLSGLKVLTGAYKAPAAHGAIRAVHTNTVPTCPYRGAGVPETTFVMERLVDMAARRFGMDGAEIRRRNVIRPEMLPWKSPTGASYHSVDYPRLIDTALARSERTKVSVPDGFLYGRGLSLTTEAYGVAFDEQAEIHVHAEGLVEVRIGTMSAGQSHETTYRQIVADVLGLTPSDIAVLQGDTDRIERGNGTGASRSLTTGGSAIHKAAEALIAEGRQAAARFLQCAPEDVRYSAGRFETSAGAPASITLAGLAEASPSGTFVVKTKYRPELFNFPGGCHIASVAVDPATGTVHLLAYEAVHDSGIAVNPMVVTGQLHGGLAQGIGAALMEAVRWDAESGQAMTATFLDYAVPRAGDLPSFSIELAGTACASNPLGAKAVGEAGPVAAPPTIVNAVINALAPLGVEHIEMPLTPARVWEAIAEAKARNQSMMKSKSAPAGA